MKCAPCLAIVLPAVTVVALLFTFPAQSAHSAPLQAAGTHDDDAYTITTTVRLAQPYDVRAMNDEFQTARLLKEAGGIGTFEITYRPFHRQTVTANPDWRREDAAMTEYLRPRPAANWDRDLQRRILQDLHEAGIDSEQLDDKTLVEKVSRWALGRSEFNSQFGLWMVEFANGRPRVAPPLRAAFAVNEPKGVPETALFDRELFGKGMYENKTHGACTSTSTYLATILRAVGIPTRIILTVPACDPNDPEQIKTLLAAVRHYRTRRAIRSGVAGQGFVNHVFNEVWVGRKWVRLNYDRLGQPILDPFYCGLMTHVFTTRDISEVPFAKTWGLRFGTEAGPKLSSVNPYQLLTARDDLKPGVAFDNPPIPALTSVTVIAVLKPGDPRMPSWVKPSQGNDALLQIKEWVKEDNYLQLRDFLSGAGHRFTLRAPGKPDVQAAITGSNYSDEHGTFQAMGVTLRGKLEPGTDYTILPANEGHPNQWIIPADVVWHGE